MESFQPKLFVFVLMPFSPDFDDVYQIGIKQACKNCEVYVERVDEQIFEGSIVERIYNQISKADIIIADMTGKNPNVFYETGYAHALGKNVILLARSLDDIPFDLKHYTHIIYNNRLIDLIPQLERKIKYLKDSTLNLPIKIMFNGNEQKDSVIRVSAKAQSVVSNRFNFVLEFHNSSRKDDKTLSFKYGFISQKENIRSFCYTDDPNYKFKKYLTENNTQLHMFEHHFVNVYPNTMKKMHFAFFMETKCQDVEIECTLRLFFDSKYYDYPLKILLKRPIKRIQRIAN